MTNLMQCDQAIQTVMHRAIKYYDFSVIFGTRTPDTQFELFQKGREFAGVAGEEKDPAKWVIVDRPSVVTFKDGFVNKSKHNYSPSQAIDVVPFPIDWRNMERFHYLGGLVMGIAGELYEAGTIKKMLRWGHDWDSDGDFDDHKFVDAPHFETIE